MVRFSILLSNNTHYALILVISVLSLLRVIMFTPPILVETSSGAAQFQQEDRGGATTRTKKVKTKTFVSKDSVECWRPCPQRINRIYYEHGASGLGDRMYIIGQLAQIAGYLCARLELPPPSILLTSHHNNGLPVSNDLNWQDFQNLTFKEDNSSIFIDQSSSSFDRNFTEWRRIPVYDPTKYSDWFYILSHKDEDTTLKDFEKIQDFSWRQEVNSTTGFIWEIRFNYYPTVLHRNILPEPSLDIRNKSRYSTEMMPVHHLGHSKNTNKKHTKTPHCEYIERYLPTDMVLLRNLIKQRVHNLSVQNSTYVYFHIRRGDVIHECDSSLPGLRKFLKCSLNGTEHFGKNITILMGSDETDVSYRQNVMSLSDGYSHVQILDADKITTDVLRESIQRGVIDKKFDNNYHVYHLQKVFQRPFVSFVLNRRRTQCRKCAPLLGKQPTNRFL